MNYYDPEHNQFISPPPRRKKRRRGNGAPVFLCVLLSLIFGAAGGVASFAFLDRRAGDAPNAAAPSVVVNQAAPVELSTQNTADTSSTVQAVAAIAAPSVVEVSTESKTTHPFYGSYITDGAGSGVVFSSDGYIITNHHVIEGANTISVRLYNGETHPAQLIATDSQNDLAVIRIDADGLTPVTFARSSDIAVGQLAVAIGNPLGTLGGTVTEGVVSATDRELVIGGDIMNLLQTSAAINQGNSGGGLFNGQGQLIGIVNAKSSGSDIEGLGFAIPSDTVLSTVTELIERGYVTGRPILGVSVSEINGNTAFYRYRLSQGGVYVTGVLQGQPFEVWDRLDRIGDIPIGGETDIKQALSQYATGDVVPVLIERNGRATELEVTLQEKTSEYSQSDVV